MCLTYCFDMLAMGVFTTMHRQTSGRLVQELNNCIVLVSVLLLYKTQKLQEGILLYPYDSIIMQFEKKAKSNKLQILLIPYKPAFSNLTENVVF